MRHFLDVHDLEPSELARILNLATDPNPPQVLAGKGAALLFEKPSARTRSATEMAVVQLGGHPVYIGASEVGLDGRGERGGCHPHAGVLQRRDRGPGVRPQHRGADGRG